MTATTPRQRDSMTGQLTAPTDVHERCGYNAKQPASWPVQWYRSYLSTGPRVRQKCARSFSSVSRTKPRGVTEKSEGRLVVTRQ